MKGYYVALKYTLFIYVCCFGVAEASNVPNIKVYGPENGVQLKERSSSKNSRHYTLYLGAFKNKNNALQAQSRAKEYSGKKAHIDYQPKGSVPYVVFMGPFSDTKTVVKISQALLAKKAMSNVQITERSFNTTTLQNTIKQTMIKTSFKQPVVMLSGGPGWSTPGKTQTLTLESDGLNTYNNQSKTQTLGMGELFVGFQKQSPRLPMQSQWGVLVSAAAMARLKGEIWQLADPEFNNMNYSYNINQLRVGLRTKWILDKYLITDKIKPYLTGSIGAGFNHSFSFYNYGKISSVVANPNFENKIFTTFNYSAGIGLQKIINQNTQLGLGYEIFDWGKSALAPATGQATNTALSINHLYMQTLLLNVTHLI